MRKFTIIILTFLSLTTYAQGNKTVTLTFERYLEMVKDNHPLALAADLQIERADAIMRSARGGFDPVLQGGLARKEFDGKEYYDLIDAGLKIPTWMGLTVNAGYNQNEGVFLNPEDNTPTQGLAHAGLSLALGKGMFVDERRAALRKAEIAQDLADARQEAMMNEVLLEAGAAYWDWFAAFHSQSVYRDALSLAQQRLENVRQSAELGERPFIDTLEAGIQVQNRALALQEAQLNRLNSGAAMSVHLWLEGLVPMELAENTIPFSLQDVDVERTEVKFLEALDSLDNYHPLLRNEMGKIAQSEINRRLKQEGLKPQLDVKYNALTSAMGDREFNDFNSEDYTFGLAFKMPIFLRKERGALQLAQIKINEQQFKLADKQQEIWMKARTAMNNLNTTADQVTLYEKTVVDYQQLLDGERDLFNSGESSLFMVNSRELGYVQAQVKRIQLLAKNRAALIKTEYALSTLMQVP